MSQEKSIAENSVSSYTKDEESKQKRDRQLAVKLALIEHGSRPLAILLIGISIVVWLFWVKDPLFNLFNQAQEFKVGSFEVRLREEADIENLGRELQALRQLSPDQLALFLVIGRQRETMAYNGPEVTEPNLRALEQVGLIFDVKPKGGEKFTWQVSPEGNRLYEIISAQLRLSINKSADE